MPAIALLAAAFIAAPAPAEPIDVQVDVPKNARNMEVEVRERDVAPGEKIAWHVHHGTEIAYVLSGSLNLQIAGGPIRHVVEGDWFEVDRDTPHRGANDGTEPARLLITYLRDKGPLSIDVPAPAIH